MGPEKLAKLAKKYVLRELPWLLRINCFYAVCLYPLLLYILCFCFSNYLVEQNAAVPLANATSSNSSNCTSFVRQDTSPNETSLALNESSIDHRVPSSNESSFDHRVPSSNGTSIDHQVPSSNESSFDHRVPSSNESSIDHRVPSSNDTSFDHRVPSSNDMSFDCLSSDLNETSFDHQNNATNGTDLTNEARRILLLHATLLLFSIAAPVGFLYYFHGKEQFNFRWGVFYLYHTRSKHIDYCDNLRISSSRESRTLTYEDELVLKTVLTTPERSAFYRWFVFACNPIRRPCPLAWIRLTSPSIYCTLTDYVMSTQWRDTYQILGDIELVHDVMKALEYLHYRHYYHLNLDADSVHLLCDGRKVHVKLSGFHFMKKAVDKKVPSTCVGLKGFYRPPECGEQEQDVDAEKCDTWGLGTIALDLFTGGTYRIHAQQSFQAVPQKADDGDELDLANSHTPEVALHLRRSRFFAYVQATYRVVDMFCSSRLHACCAYCNQDPPEEPSWFRLLLWHRPSYRTYNVCHLTFLSQLRKYVHKLLLSSPVRRMDLERAYEEPLISRRRPPTTRLSLAKRLSRPLKSTYFELFNQRLDDGMQEI